MVGYIDQLPVVLELGATPVLAETIKAVKSLKATGPGVTGHYKFIS